MGDRGRSAITVAGRGGGGMGIISPAKISGGVRHPFATPFPFRKLQLPQIHPLVQAHAPFRVRKIQLKLSLRAASVRNI